MTDQEGFELDTTQTRCIELDFPGKAMGMRHLLRRNTVAGPISWMGSLVQDNQDASGLMYRRNRFYDPKSGRFTQEDPIGLAGGVNLYGFAEGDPVSYDDPMGLWIYCQNKRACRMWQRVYNRALAAHQRGVRGGTRVWEMMNALAESDEMIAVRVNWYGSRATQYAGRCRFRDSNCPRGAAATVRVSENDIGGISGDLRLVHELGHVYEHEVLNRPWTENSQPEAIGWENE